MMKMMENFEQKVDHYQKKEDYMKKLFQNNRDKIEEALLERDRAKLREQQKEKQLRTLQSQSRGDQSQLKEYHSRAYDQLKNKQRAALDAKEGEISTLTQQVISMKVQKERIDNEYS